MVNQIVIGIHIRDVVGYAELLCKYGEISIVTASAEQSRAEEGNVLGEAFRRVASRIERYKNVLQLVIGFMLGELFFQFA